MEQSKVTLGIGPAICALTSSPGESAAGLSLRTTV